MKVKVNTTSKNLVANIKVTWTIQPATEPNPDKKLLELLDGDGWRVTYINTEDEAVNEMHKCLDELGITFDDIHTAID